MKKKENLKKLSLEEKPVSVIRRSIYYSFVIGLFSISTLEAQIPINGFCRYSEFNSNIPATNIFSVDFNNDGYRDLIVYNSNNNKYLSLTADVKLNYKTSSSNFLPFAIFDMHAFGKEASTKKFLIVSRKSKQVLLGSFSKRGNLSVSNKLKFNDYPSTIDVGDINGDGKPEGLVAGTASNGFYLIKEKNKKLTETQIQPRKIFSNACFIDLNYDSFLDIAAVDLLRNSIIFFYNDGSGNFAESRSIGINDDIKEFKPADINSDGFTDLVFIKNNHFEIYLGDSVSSFQNKMTLDTPVNPDRYAVLDFNGDGYNDIAFLNSESGLLYILFGKNGKTFYEPILFMQKPGLKDLTAFIDRTGKKLAAVDSNGKIFLINAIGIDQDSFSITLGQKPTAVKTFDYLDDKFNDICFIDETDHSLKLLVSERRNLCRIYYRIPLSARFSDFVIDDSRAREKTFFCFSRGERVIDVVRMNFDNQGYSKQTIYADGIIEDLKFLSDRLRDRVVVYVLIKKGDTLRLQNIEFRDFRVTSSNTISVGSKFERAWISFGVFKEIYGITVSDKKLELVKVIVDRKVVEKKPLLSFNLLPKDKLNYDLICIDELINRNKPDALGITVNKQSFLYIFTADSYKKYKLKKISNSKFSLNYYSFLEAENELTFYFIDYSHGVIHSATFKDLNKAPVEKDMIESRNINNYLITDLINKKTFLIYSDDLKNILTFKKF